MRASAANISASRLFACSSGFWPIRQRYACRDPGEFEIVGEECGFCVLIRWVGDSELEPRDGAGHDQEQASCKAESQHLMGNDRRSQLRDIGRSLFGHIGIIGKTCECLRVNGGLAEVGMRRNCRAAGRLRFDIDGCTREQIYCAFFRVACEYQI